MSKKIKEPIITCDNCGNDFVIRVKEKWCVKEGKEIAGEPVRVSAFMCPHCEKVYIASVMTMKMIVEAECSKNVNRTLTAKEKSLREKFSAAFYAAQQENR